MIYRRDKRVHRESPYTHTCRKPEVSGRRARSGWRVFEFQARETDLTWREATSYSPRTRPNITFIPGSWRAARTCSRAQGAAGQSVSAGNRAAEVSATNTRRYVIFAVPRWVLRRNSICNIFPDALRTPELRRMLEINDWSAAIPWRKLLIVSRLEKCLPSKPETSISPYFLSLQYQKHTIFNINPRLLNHPISDVVTKHS